MVEQRDFLRLHDISKSFAGVRALSHVDLDVSEGEVHSLVGENGSGKSTLIKIIAGVLQPDEGAEIHIAGRSIRRLNAFDSISAGIQVIYQDLSLFPNLTVAENIAMSQYIQDKKTIVSRKEMTTRARESMAMVEVDIPPSTTVGELPIAKQQIVAVCRSITRGGKLIIMDEPTSSLSRRDVDCLFEVVRNLKAKGISILFVCHKLDEVFEIADRVTILRDGECIGRHVIAELTRERLVQIMTGRTITYRDLPQSVREEGFVLETRGLTRSGKFREVSFGLRRGEILGVAGLVGSGRTELASAIFGLDQADSGEILVDGRRVRIRSVQDAVACGIGYVPEGRLVQGLFMEHSVKNNLIVTVLKSLVGKAGLLQRNHIREFASSWISKLGIKTPSGDVLVKQLSGGNQQRVVLSKWLERNPKVLILDSPTVGVDVGAKEEIHALIAKLAEEGMGIIMISDEVAEVVHHTHEFLLMKEGEIVGRFQSPEISENELLDRLLEK